MVVVAAAGGGGRGGGEKWRISVCKPMRNECWSAMGIQSLRGKSSMNACKKSVSKKIEARADWKCGAVKATQWETFSLVQVIEVRGVGT